MKVGLIVESGPEGLEDLVLPKIIKLLEAECKIEIEYEIRTMSGKDSLISDCAKTARALFSDGFNRVVIIWDENPGWSEEKSYTADRCWHREREGIRNRLGAEKVPLAKVGLVCVEREFETILMHDMDLIRAVISPSIAHPARIKKLRDPLLIENPTDWLERQFRINKSRYNKVVVAKKFAAYMNRLDGIKRCNIFRYLVEQILGHMPQEWEPYVYVPRGPKR